MSTLQGWHADPFGTHEQRYFSAGQPTALVRDGSREANDPPPPEPVADGTAAYSPPPPFAPEDGRYGPQSAPFPSAPFPSGPFPSAPFPSAPFPPVAPRAELGATNARDGADDPFAPLYAAQRRRLVRRVVVLLVVLGALGAGAYFLFFNGAPGRPTVPEGFDGYTLLHNDAAARLTANAQTTARGMNVAIAAYGRDTGDRPVLVAFVFRRADVDAGLGAGQPGSASASDNVIADDLMQQVSSDALPLPPGAQGGYVECGHARIGAFAGAVCAWSDPRWAGLVLSVQPTTTPEQLATVANDLRAKVH